MRAKNQEPGTRSQEPGARIKEVRGKRGSGAFSKYS